MGEILHQLGIDAPKLVAQVLIFGIVYLVLRKYAFGPVTAILEERRRRIVEGEENLTKIRENLAGSEQKAAEIIAKANADAERLIRDAKESAAAVAETRRQEAVAEAQQIIAKAREATNLERERVLSDLKRDFGRLVVNATGKVTGKVLTGEDHERLNREALAELN